MNKYVSRGLWTVLATGGFMALGVGVAHADTATSGTDGIASGTQGILGIELPLQLGGNAISLLGDAHSAGATTGAPAASGSGDAASSGGTSGAGGVGSGTQLLPELGLPITLGGNSISILGNATTASAQTAPAAGAGGSGGASAPSGTTDGTGGTLSGTQLLADLGIPVTLGGNAISVLGDANSAGAQTSPGTTGGAGDGASSGTDGTDGILGGSQLLAGLGVPVTLGGNAISVLGTATSSGAATDPAAAPGGQEGLTGTAGTEGLLSG